MENKSYLTQDIEVIAKCCTGTQKKYYQQVLDSAKEIDVVLLNEVFTKEEIRDIKRYARPEKKMCYKNATLLMQLFPDKVKYVEGRVSVCGLGIDHAFNKVGDKYIDVTFELCLREDVRCHDYISIGEYDIDTVAKVIVETKQYGNVFKSLLLKSIA